MKVIRQLECSACRKPLADGNCFVEAGRNFCGSCSPSTAAPLVARLTVPRSPPHSSATIREAPGVLEISWRPDGWMTGAVYGALGSVLPTFLVGAVFHSGTCAVVPLGMAVGAWFAAGRRKLTVTAEHLTLHGLLSTARQPRRSVTEVALRAGKHWTSRWHDKDNSNSGVFLHVLGDARWVVQMPNGATGWQIGQALWRQLGLEAPRWP